MSDPYTSGLPEVAREDFIAAIEAGIRNSGGLSTKHIDALREVGRSGKQIHRSFAGCPWTLAGLPSHYGLTFATAYDQTIRPHFPRGDGSSLPGGWFKVV